MNVLHVIPEFTTGGMESQVRRLADALARLDVKCHVHASHKGNPNGWSGDGVTVSWCPEGLSFLGRTRCTARLISRVPPDIVHAHLSLSGYLAAKVACTPNTVSHYQNVYPPRGEMSAVKLWRWQAFDRFCSGDLALACSEAVRRQCISQNGLQPSRVKTLYNGVDIHELDTLAEQRPTGAVFQRAPDEVLLLFVGRLVPQKGLSDLIQSLAMLPDDIPWRLAIVGDGPLKTALLDQTRNSGLDARVDFLGARSWSDVPGILSASDVFVHPSRWEGLGLSIVEASACRLPVVATNVGGIPEVVENGVSGTLVEPGDTEALCSAITELVQNRDLRREMGEAGRQIVEEKFDINRIALELKHMYEELLSSKFTSSRNVRL